MIKLASRVYNPAEMAVDGGAPVGATATGAVHNA
jgi:hypothetical protein